jgi:hypothetical protein
MSVDRANGHAMGAVSITDPQVVYVLQRLDYHEQICGVRYATLERQVVETKTDFKNFQATIRQNVTRALWLLAGILATVAGDLIVRLVF